MNLAEKEKLEVGKGKSAAHGFNSAPIASDWRFSGRIGDTSAGIIHRGNLLGFSKDDMAGTSSSSASVAVADSFLQSSWDHAVGSQALGLCDSSCVGIQRGGTGALRSCCMKSLLLDPPNSMSRNCIFSPNIVGVLPPPQSLSQFPSDSAFIERAARFSSFNGGNFSEIANPFPIPETLSLYNEGGGVSSVSQGFSTMWMSPIRAHSLKNEVNICEISKGASLCSDHDVVELRRSGNDGENESLVRDHNQGIEASTNGSDEAEFSGDVGQDEASMFDCTSEQPNSIKFIGSKKRKKIMQDAELLPLKGPDLAPESSQKVEQNPATNKSLPKPTKNGSQSSEIPKEEYIHVRARRGQATNSHSLAERVRREKISERMKFLQDLVPGCSKVTGKAVMLDEIINYVQSLQRQVEFLSMKLATVNPRPDFNFEGLHGKNMVDSLPVVGFSGPDMTTLFQQLPPAPQPGIFCLRNPSPSMASQLPSLHTKGPPPPSSTQVVGGGSMWEDELHNIVQMSFAGSDSGFDTEDAHHHHHHHHHSLSLDALSGTQKQDQMKIKL